MASEVFRLVGRIVVEGTKKVASSFTNIGKQTQELTKELDKVGETTEEVGKTFEETRKEMVKAMRDQREALKGLRTEQMKNEIAWFNMGKASKDFQGTTKDFMKQVADLGKADKKLTDQMVANNRIRLGNFYQTVGAMLARSGQSEKIAQNFERMGNPLYTVNNGLLAVTGSLEKLARAGMPAVTALRMLGPNASMKELQDMTRMLTQGQMRFQSVLLASAIALGVFTGALLKASFGPDPAKVRADIAQLEKVYDEEFEKRRQQIYEWSSLFENIDIKPFNPDKLLANLAEQVKIMENWMKDLGDLARRGVDEGLIAELEKMGPKASGEIHALTHMTDKQLDEYVKLWQEKHALAREQTTSELEQLRKETDRQIQELKDSLEPLGVSWEKFVQTWTSALEPFVDQFGLVASKVVDFGTRIGEFFVKLNETSPWVIQVIGWFTFLAIALTMLLAPLAIGAGLVNGFMVAWAGIAPFVMPLITGLATMSATVWLIVGAIIALVAIGIAMYNSFKNWVNGSEEARTAWNNFVTDLKDKAEKFIAPLRDLFSRMMEGIKSAVSGGLSGISGFWEEHGTQVLSAISNFLDILLGIWNFIFPLLEFIVVGVVQGIINVIQGFFNIVMGAVKIFTGLFTGDWSLLWEGLKQMFSGAIEFIWGIMNLMFFGRIIKGVGAFIKSMFTNFVGFFRNLKTNTQNFVQAVINWFMALGTRLFNIWMGVRTQTLSLWNGIKQGVGAIFSSLRTAITSIAQSIWNTVKTKFQAVYNAIKTPITNAWKSVKEMLGKIKNAFTNFTWRLPKLKLPDVDISIGRKTIGGISVPYPRFDVDWNASGNIFDEPSIIGIGERGREAVVPLEGRQVRPWAEEVAKLIPANAGGGAGPIEVPVYLDGREIARAMTPNLNRTLERERRISNRGRGIQS